ncbi:hypothetical protein Tco_1161673, partial [Tanacetum coccineum]
MDLFMLSVMAQCVETASPKDIDAITIARLVPSCCVIFDLYPLSLSFDF